MKTSKQMLIKGSVKRIAKRPEAKPLAKRPAMTKTCAGEG